LHVAGSDGGEDLGAGIEAAEVDFISSGLGELAVGDGDAGGQGVGLIADDHLLGFGENGRAGDQEPGDDGAKAERGTT
jgi:hypothetical protein